MKKIGQLWGSKGLNEKEGLKKLNIFLKISKKNKSIVSLSLTHTLSLPLSLSCTHTHPHALTSTLCLPHTYTLSLYYLHTHTHTHTQSLIHTLSDTYCLTPALRPTIARCSGEVNFILK